MTKKRFIEPNKECRVIKNTKTGETAIYYDTEDGLMFLKWLNELHEENRRLQRHLDVMRSGALTDDKRIKELYDENEQLKQFKNKVFNLLQDEIREESELLDYYLKEKAPYNADRQQIIIGVLKRLQKELEE